MQVTLVQKAQPSIMQLSIQVNALIVEVHQSQEYVPKIHLKNTFMDLYKNVISEKLSYF